ncbi:trafficking regulator of GLUT4 (SLC2A4) 1b [Ictalurus punctatus]|uniref:Trafficking regulator of GLUT4 (SLC2A4) 1b n=1 Tax=Ictalurus punctatus TaxID=7998 RepID=A0A2D0T0U7_ICTPU|nr:trafficking regulator of GLUT4 (SLC2A4) 1b [Ictalurus punctatus]
MAINTDAEFERSAMGESSGGGGGGGEGGEGGGGAAEFRDTQKLLGVVVGDGKDGLGSCSDSRRPSVKSLKSLRSLNVEQNSYKSTGTGSVQSLPRSPAPERTEPEPRSYMWLALFSCFCPALPLNAIALYFSHASRSMTQANDYDGARRLGQRSLLFSVLAIAVGLSIILYLAITES